MLVPSLPARLSRTKALHCEIKFSELLHNDDTESSSYVLMQGHTVPHSWAGFLCLQLNWLFSGNFGCEISTYFQALFLLSWQKGKLHGNTICCVTVLKGPWIIHHLGLYPSHIARWYWQIAWQSEVGIFHTVPSGQPCYSREWLTLLIMTRILFLCSSKTSQSVPQLCAWAQIYKISIKQFQSHLAFKQSIYSFFHQ